MLSSGSLLRQTVLLPQSCCLTNINQADKLGLCPEELHVPFFVVKNHGLLGDFKQTTELFHRFFSKTTTGVALNYFLISQKLPVFHS
jgi:hypothetical protein